MKHKTQIWVWVGVAVVVIIIVAFLVGVSRTAVNQNGAWTYAGQGAFVPGFPQGLIMDNPQAMTENYSLNYPATTDQYTALWSSSSSVENVYADYVNYFQANGWALSSLPIKDLNRRILSASIGTGYALLTITADGTGSRVEVTYVMQ